MEFKCTNNKCGKVFRPHKFIGFRHPSLAKCPICKAKGKRTEHGKEEFKSMHGSINISRGKMAGRI